MIIKFSKLKIVIIIILVSNVFIVSQFKVSLELQFQLDEEVNETIDFSKSEQVIELNGSFLKLPFNDCYSKLILTIENEIYETQSMKRLYKREYLNGRKLEKFLITFKQIHVGGSLLECTAMLSINEELEWSTLILFKTYLDLEGGIIDKKSLMYLVK